MTSKFKIVADLSIQLRFDGPQPNAFGVDPATAVSLGDTRTGSSVNFEQYTFTPHCNGTHTECIGHITDERIYIRDCLRDVLMTAQLVSVEPVPAGNGDSVITTEALRLAGVGVEPKCEALIIRTLPNDDSKLTQSYGPSHIPAYFTQDAVGLIVTCGFTHMLTDLPSIDRLFDDGKLLNHRFFWNVEPGSRDIHSASRIYSTITEMIYVPTEVEDGRYTLNLQIAPFQSDAAPSRPLLLSED